MLLIHIRKEKGFTLLQMTKKLSIPLKDYKRIEEGKFKSYDKPIIQHIDKILGTHLYKTIFAKKYTTHYWPDNMVSQAKEGSAKYESINQR